MMAYPSSKIRFFQFFSLLTLVAFSNAQLSLDFYRNSCPGAISTVSQMVTSFLTTDPNLAGGLQRLHFHDCWVRGCEGSVLLDSTSVQAEKDSVPNQNSLRGFAQIDQIKAALEVSCPGIVSCADILALAARDATVQAGGPNWKVTLGRRDGVVSLATEAVANLPSPDLDFDDLVSNFASIGGMSATEMIVLSGAHTFGRARCASLQNRLYNFNNVTGQTDPLLNATFATTLKGLCPQNDISSLITMDTTPNRFDSDYYNQLLLGQGAFTSDQTIMTSTLGVSYTTQAIQAGSTFIADFAAAMEKMSILGVLTGAAGEIRQSCAVING